MSSNATTLVATPGPSVRAQRARVLRRWTALALLAAATLIVAYKLSGAPGSAWAAHALSLETLPAEMRARAHHLLFTPVGALVVVLVRLTLGIRVLGPFRSVLLAIAFLVTGPLVGVIFFAIVLGAVVVFRPLLKAMKLPYFGKSAAMLTAVASLVTAAMMVGVALGVREVETVVFFPLVVLTLAGDAFATALRREGARSALWRAGATAATAVAITALASVRPLHDALMRYPELMLAVLGCILVVGDLMGWRLLQGLNPPRRRKPKPGVPVGQKQHTPPLHGGRKPEEFA